MSNILFVFVIMSGWVGKVQMHLLIRSLSPKSHLALDVTGRVIHMQIYPHIHIHI